MGRGWDLEDMMRHVWYVGSAGAKRRKEAQRAFNVLHEPKLVDTRESSLLVQELVNIKMVTAEHVLPIWDL